MTVSDEVLDALYDGIPSIEMEPEPPPNFDEKEIESAHIQDALPLDSTLTDSANAARLAQRHINDLCFVSEWGWLSWDGKKWQQDKSNQAMTKAMATAKSIYHEAAEATDNRHARRLAHWANQSLSRSRLEAMLSLAQSALSARPDEFDRDPWVLNVQNGLLDLKTGELKNQNPQAKITKIAGTEYRPDAEAMLWLVFLDRIFGNDQTMVDFVQRMTGYFLTGDASEQCLFFGHGRGANGKTTYANVILAMLGDYGKQSAPNLLMAGERHPTEIADLHGARFVATIEVEEGRRLAEVLTKQLTGGDRIKARFMRHDFFEFETTFKILLLANHQPNIKGTDYAIWRRIRKIPFDIVIPENERDPHLVDKLKEELPGILAWAVKGCLDWQKNGLMVPQKVLQATDAYRSEMDILGIFIEDSCLQGKQYEAGSSLLYKTYCGWCESNGEKPISQRAFSMHLAERGLNKRQTRTGAIWEGIGIKNDMGL
jgi:putative DNA primase/helicase